MENRNVGYLLLGISILVLGIIFLYNNSLNNYIEVACPLVHEGKECPAQNAINQQTYFVYGIAGLLVIISLVLIFSKPQKEIIIKKIKERKIKKKIDTSGLKSEEKKVLKLVQDDKAIFQADLIEKTDFGKAKMTRIIDRLEGKGFVERKRRGMTNIVVLKDN